MKFTEATRVQIPAMVHLTRLGYKYFGKISEDEFNNRMAEYKSNLSELFNESHCLEAEIMQQLDSLKFNK
jgi:hypothetical protein